MNFTFLRTFLSSDITSLLSAIREPLTREFEQNSQDNRYYLQLIARAYEDGEGNNVAQVLADGLGVGRAGHRQNVLEQGGGLMPKEIRDAQRLSK